MLATAAAAAARLGSVTLLDARRSACPHCEDGRMWIVAALRKTRKAVSVVLGTAAGKRGGEGASPARRHCCSPSQAKSTSMLVTGRVEALDYPAALAVLSTACACCVTPSVRTVACPPRLYLYFSVAPRARRPHGNRRARVFCRPLFPRLILL